MDGEDLFRQAVGRRLLCARHRAGITQRDLAAAVGCTRETISMLERGKNLPRVAVLVTVAARLGVRIGWILGEEREEKQKHFTFTSRTLTKFEGDDIIGSIGIIEVRIHGDGNIC